MERTSFKITLLLALLSTSSYLSAMNNSKSLSHYNTENIPPVSITVRMSSKSTHAIECTLTTKCDSGNLEVQARRLCSHKLNKSDTNYQFKCPLPPDTLMLIVGQEFTTIPLPFPLTAAYQVRVKAFELETKITIVGPGNRTSSLTLPHSPNNHVLQQQPQITQQPPIQISEI